MNNEPLITKEERERLLYDINFREALGFEIGRAENTLWQWAKHFPERFSNAALKWLRAYIKKHPIEQEA